MRKLLLLFTLSFCVIASADNRQKFVSNTLNSRLQALSLPLYKQAPVTKPVNQTPIVPNDAQQVTSVVYNEDGSVNVPFVFAPTKEDFAKFKVVNNNQDDRTWKFDAKKKTLMYRYSTKVNADDYVILPAINIVETSKVYQFTIDAAPSNYTYGESFEMCVGRSPNPKDLKTIYTSGMIYGVKYDQHKAYFHATEPGLYYVAVRATSPRNGWRFYVKNLGVSQTEISVAAPDYPTQVKAKAADLGKNEAIVTFKMPVQTAGATPLAADVSLTAMLKSSVGMVMVTGLPGTEQQAVVRTEQGQNELSLVVTNPDGEGLPIKMKLYTGKDLPVVPVVSTSVSDDNMTMHLSWEKNTVGVNGGYVDPNEVSYKLKKYKEVAGMGTWEDTLTLGNITTYDYTLRAGEKMQIANLGITASSSMGENKEVAVASEMIGTPYALPVVECLRRKKINITPVAPEEIDENSNATWGFMNPAEVLEGAANESGAAMVGYITHTGKSLAKLTFPKFSMEGQSKVNLEMEVYFHDLMPQTQVYAYMLGSEDMLLGTLDATMGKGWKKVSFALPPACAGKKWVGWYIKASYPGVDENEYLLIDKYLIRPVIPNDLAVTVLDGTEKTTVGKQMKYKATVENFGTQATQLKEARFILLADGVQISSSDVVKSDAPVNLAPNQAVSFEYEFEATADLIGNIQVKFDIVHDDAVPGNNTLDTKATIQKGDNPVVTDLAGKNDEAGDGMTLTWTSVGKLVGLQGFEKTVPFYYGAKLEEFKNVDMDKKNTYTPTSFRLPHQGYAKAFQVFNYEQAHVTIESYKPHGGKQCLIAFCPDDQTTKADDWLISPAVKGGSTVKFWMNILNEKYSPEVVEFLVSNKTDDSADFTLVETIQKANVAWQEYSFKLPDDAKYFAIRYHSFDQMGVMIDDIDYIPASGEPVVTYRVYKNGQQIAADLNASTYHVNKVAEGDYINVTVCVDGVEYAKSNTVHVVSTGIDAVNGDEECQIVDLPGALSISAPVGKKVDVWTIDGRLVVSLPTTGGVQHISVPGGSYIVRIGRCVRKVVVR